MQVNKEEMSPCEVALTIEVDTEIVAKAIEKAYKDYGRYTAIPGFRKGKAPRQIIEKFVSEDKIRDHAAEDMMQPAFLEALESTGIEPWDSPQVEIVQLEADKPFIFKATVPLSPKVELGDYMGIGVERLVAKVSDEDIDGEIQALRDRMAESIDVTDRPVKADDLVTVELIEEGKDDEPERRVVQAGQNLPSFDEGIIGIATDGEKDITVIYPEDFEAEDMRGKSVNVHVKVLGIRCKKAPEATDEFAQEISEKVLGEKVETMDQLKAKIREARENMAAIEADREVSTKLVKEIADRSTVSMPRAMVDQEVAHRLQDVLRMLEERKTTLEDYIAQTGRSFEQIRTEIEEAAEKDLTVSLVLSEIGDKENISLEDKDVDEEIERMAEANGVPKESVKAYLDKTDGLQGIENRIIRRKILDFLTQGSNIKNIG